MFIHWGVNPITNPCKTASKITILCIFPSFLDYEGRYKRNIKRNVSKAIKRHCECQFPHFHSTANWTKNDCKTEAATTKFLRRFKEHNTLDKTGSSCVRKVLNIYSVNNKTDDNGGKKFSFSGWKVL